MSLSEISTPNYKIRSDHHQHHHHHHYIIIIVIIIISIISISIIIIIINTNLFLEFNRMVVKHIQHEFSSHSCSDSFTKLLHLLCCLPKQSLTKISTTTATTSKPTTTTTAYHNSFISSSTIGSISLLLT